MDHRSHHCYYCQCIRTMIATQDHRTLILCHSNNHLLGHNNHLQQANVKSNYIAAFYIKVYSYKVHNFIQTLSF
jgi:hypothetical protein